MGAIRTEQTRLLQENGTENIEFFVYDKDGNAKATLKQSKDVLKQIPSNLTPINEDLVAEYQRPLRDAIKTVKSSSSYLINKNPNFRYNSFNWNITASKATVQIPSQIIANVQPISGIYCLYQENLATAESKTTHLIKNILSDSPIVSGRDISIVWNYYIQAFLGLPLIEQYISIGLDSTNNGTINKMYNFEENKFETGTFTDAKFFKKIDYTELNSWNKYQTTLQVNLTSTETNPHIEVKLFEARSFVTLGGKFFLDGFSISQKAISTTKTITRRRGAFLLTGLLSSFNVSSEEEKSITGEYKQKQIILSNELDRLDVSAIEFVYARKDRPGNAILTSTLDSCVLQEIINDYRDPLKRYEGSFYKDDADVVPIYFYHKLWVNFGTTVLQEPVACIIDQMEYNVKQNNYRIVMHIPNQDDDQVAFNTYNFD
tara:strand:+ start:221 stop:1513 length:1293 start_codon:yes stop_codon:yes gene_type:complete